MNQMPFVGQKRLHSERQQMGVIGEIPAPNELLKRKKLMDEITKERVLPPPFGAEDGRNCTFFS